MGAEATEYPHFSTSIMPIRRLLHQEITRITEKTACYSLYILALAL